MVCTLVDGEMKAKYVQMSDDCLVKLDRHFKTECCDCGLVHEWKLVFRNKEPYFKIKRDNRATGQRRRNSRYPYRFYEGKYLNKPAPGAGKEGVNDNRI